MLFQALPPEITELLYKLNAPPRLMAHLTVVHDVAITITKKLEEQWPNLQYDKQAVLIGAASHDIGKTVYTHELTGPGQQHEEIGPNILTKNGIPENYVRFARTHGRWQQEPSIQLEDLLVAFADTIWKGARDEALEMAISQQISKQTHEEIWQDYMKIDDIASEIARESHARIVWQGK